MGWTWDIKREAAGFSFHHGEDEGMHRLSICHDDDRGSQVIVDISGMPVTDTMVKKIERVVAREMFLHLLDEGVK